jgi:type I restriction enzyme S subunit
VEEKVLSEVLEKTTTVDPRKKFIDIFNYIDIGSISSDKNKIPSKNEIPVSAAPSRARKLVAAGDTIFATTRPI